MKDFADRVTDSDPQMNIYIPTHREVSDVTDYILNDILIDNLYKYFLQSDITDEQLEDPRTDDRPLEFFLNISIQVLKVNLRFILKSILTGEFT